MSNPIAWLSITCYAGSIGGEHYRGRLIVSGGDPYDIEVRKTVTRTVAEALNKKDAPLGELGAYKVGEMTGRFDTRKGVEDASIPIARKTWPGVRLIVRGFVGTVPPRAVIWCDDETIGAELAALTVRAKEIYKETLDPWRDGYGDEMDEIIAGCDAAGQALGGRL